MKIIRTSLLIAAILTANHFQKVAATPLSPSASDLSVMVEAVEATTPLAASNAPLLGNFYSAQHAPGSASPWPPLPGNISDSPVWSLGDGLYLLDDLDVSYTPQTKSLIGGMHAMDDAGPPLPGGGGDGGTNEGGSFPIYTFPTNGLWLQVTDISNGQVYLNLMNATDSVYEILSKTDLTLTNWSIEPGEVWSTNTNAMPFTVNQAGRTNLFLWAADWTGVTENGNTTPDWWFWEYFGTTDLSDTNLDSTGENTLQYDYQNGIDPNQIQFLLQFTNYNVNTSPAYGTVTITGGTPFYEAVLVNDADEADAVWAPYTGTNVLVPLTESNGLSTVWVGLRGWPTNATQTWLETQLTFNNLAPTLTLTNPTTSTVSTPLIQLQGYVSVSLSKLTFDVSNAAGVFTNQTGYWQPMFYDTNLMQFTTNSFQCYDVALTNGLNQITLHAVDVAGNSTVTNFSYTLSYAGVTNPPLLSLIWPTNSTVIGGTNFTLQATVDDATASVSATLNGNTVQGLVERDGTVWVNNLPLNAGTNQVTLSATNAAGLSSQTNFEVIGNDVGLVVDPISGGQLNQTNVSVTGSIGNTNDTVSVNGTNAYYLDDVGDWEADNVPVSATGTAELDAEVTDADNNPVAAQRVYQLQLPMVALANYQQDSASAVFDDAIVEWDYASGGNWGWENEGYSDGGPIPPDGTNYTAPLVTSDSGETFSPTWQNADAAYYTYRTSIQTTVMIVPCGPKLPGVTKSYTVGVAAIAFDPIISFPDGGDMSFFGPQLIPGNQNQPNLLMPPEQLQINGKPLVNSSNIDWYGAAWGTNSVSAPAGTLVPLYVTTTGGDYDYTFEVEIVPDKLYWQNMVEAEIDTDSGVVIENYQAGNGFLNNRANVKAIYDFYATLFTEEPTEFYWCGLAKLAGAPVYAGLSDAEYCREGFVTSGYLTLGITGPLASLAAQFQTNLMGMNIDIYSDMDWQFVAYQNGGLQALEDIYAMNNNALDIDAWEEIDDGIQNGDEAEIQDGNTLLAQREQEVILVQDYDNLSNLFPGTSSLISRLAQNPVIGGPDFLTLEPGGDLANTDERWDWVSRSYTSITNTGIFPLWLQESPASRVNDVQQPLLTRALQFSYVWLYINPAWTLY